MTFRNDPTILRAKVWMHMRPVYATDDDCKQAIAKALACSYVDEIFEVSADRWQMLIDLMAARPAHEIRKRWEDDDVEYLQTRHLPKERK